MFYFAQNHQSIFEMFTFDIFLAKSVQHFLAKSVQHFYFTRNHGLHKQDYSAQYQINISNIHNQGTYKNWKSDSLVT